MTKVKVLVEGYAKEDSGTESASSTTTLLQDGDLNIVVDPGMDRQKLLTSLKAENLSPGDINYVVLTHTHLDHCLLAGIFENAKILDNDSVYSSEGRISSHDGKVPGTDIEIIKTPGHDQFHCSVVANTEDLGKVVIAGDIFWWKNNQTQETNAQDLIKHSDPYVKNESQLTESRKKVLEIADYIIPGHGKIFRVNK